MKTLSMVTKRGAQVCGILLLGCVVVPVGAVVLAGWTLYSNHWIEAWTDDEPRVPHCGT
jgi:TRAP-type C4-dicarboxylate transport system permease small subunit